MHNYFTIRHKAMYHCTILFPWPTLLFCYRNYGLISMPSCFFRVLKPIVEPNLISHSSYSGTVRVCKQIACVCLCVLAWESMCLSTVTCLCVFWAAALWWHIQLRCVDGGGGCGVLVPLLLLYNENNQLTVFHYIGLQAYYWKKALYTGAGNVHTWGNLNFIFDDTYSFYMEKDWGSCRIYWPASVDHV